MAARKATKTEMEVFVDEALDRNILTGEVLKEKRLCPLVVVRSRGSGVHVGLLADYDPKTQHAILLDSRRIWRWYGANTLTEVARHGISEESRVSEPCPQMAVAEVVEVIPVSAEAAPSLTTSRWPS